MEQNQVQEKTKTQIFLDKVKKGVKPFLKNILRNHNYVFSLIVMIIVAQIANPSFLTIDSIMILLRQASILGVLALGMTLVILIGGIDLSVGSMLALSAAVSVLVYNASGGSIVLTLLFALAFGAILGLFNGVFVGKLKIAGFVVTLATLAAYRSITVQVGNGGPLALNTESYYQTLRNIGYGTFLGIPYLVLIFVIATILVWVMLTKTKLGRSIYAVGSNEKAAKLSGVKVDWVKIIVYGLSGVLAGLAAFLYLARMGTLDSSTAARGLETDAIAAVAIGGASMAGGKGFIQGTFFGAIILYLINNILNSFGIPALLVDLIKGALILIAVVLQQLLKKNKE